MLNHQMTQLSNKITWRINGLLRAGMISSRRESNHACLSALHPMEEIMTQRRWNCSHCETSGWSSDGRTPAHDRPTGVSSRKSGQVSEKEAKKRVTPGGFVDVGTITEYGLTQKLSLNIRCF